MTEKIMILLTHIFAGVLIQIFCFEIFIFPFNIILTILFAFLSHFVLDAFVVITYHPPDPQKGDFFWLSWQIIGYGSGIVFAFIFYLYLLGSLFANLVDIIDWVILRKLDRRKTQKIDHDWNKNYFFHEIIAKIRRMTLFWLPDWKYEKKAIIIEIIIIIGLFIGIIFLIV